MYLQFVDRKYPLHSGPNTVGRAKGNDIILDHPKVSLRHCVVTVEAGRIQVEDLQSTNGTQIKGQKITRSELQVGEAFQIAGESAHIIQSAASPESDALQRLKKAVHQQLLERMNLKRVNLSDLADHELQGKARHLIAEILGAMTGTIPADADREALAREILQDTLGLGPLEDLLGDASVTEIMVNNSRRIYVERSGKLQISNKTFDSDAHVMEIMERIVAPLGRRIDESSPMVDARLKDGSRVNAVIPPLSLRGPCLTIRKFSKRKLTPDDLVKFGSVSDAMLGFLQIAVKYRRNIVISGGTGSGKTTLLNILSSYIPSDERILTIEDSAELQLPQEHVVSLESRPANIEGTGSVTIRDLVRNSLRMRPDRIVVGECRGGEALDMLQAMNTGHDGSLTTVHANTPRDALSRLETMCLMSGTELPLRALRDQVCSAIDVIVQQSRMPDGSRKITHVTEVLDIGDERIRTQDLFLFRQRGLDKDGRVTGLFEPAGMIPVFYEELTAAGLSLDLSIFQPKK